MQISSKLHATLLCLVALTVLGCGGSRYPSVSGKATGDGVPLPGVLVTFAPEGSWEQS